MLIYINSIAAVSYTHLYSLRCSSILSLASLGVLTPHNLLKVFMLKGILYNLPFNMNTFNKLWGVNTPKEAKDKIEEQRREYAHILSLIHIYS